ncbi:MAG: hypothetical protein EBS06_08030 [Proteobacteria bacterium]|nr:hypothetical protein [Pseudomonadota bacterium]
MRREREKLGLKEREEFGLKDEEKSKELIKVQKECYEFLEKNGARTDQVIGLLEYYELSKAQKAPDLLALPNYLNLFASKSVLSVSEADDHSKKFAENSKSVLPVSEADDHSKKVAENNNPSNKSGPSSSIRSASFINLNFLSSGVKRLNPFNKSR